MPKYTILLFPLITLLLNYSNPKVGHRPTYSLEDERRIPIEEISNESVCESIDEISKEEIESQKDDIKSRLINIDYETYIKQILARFIGRRRDYYCKYSGT